MIRSSLEQWMNPSRKLIKYYVTLFRNRNIYWFVCKHLICYYIRECWTNYLSTNNKLGVVLLMKAMNTIVRAYSFKEKSINTENILTFREQAVWKIVGHIFRKLYLENIRFHHHRHFPLSMCLFGTPITITFHTVLSVIHFDGRPRV